jgi:hypothetical protein
MHDRSKLVLTYARTTRNCFAYSLEPCRVEWLGYFWVELLSPSRSCLGLGSAILPYFTLLSLGMLVPCFPVSMENRDLG